MNSLPHDIHYYLFNFLSAKDIIKSSRVNKLWYSRSRHLLTWKNKLDDEYLLSVVMKGVEETRIYHPVEEELKKKFSFEIYKLFTVLRRKYRLYPFTFNGLKKDLITDISTLAPYLVYFTRRTQLLLITRTDIKNFKYSFLLPCGTQVHLHRYLINYIANVLLDKITLSGTVVCTYTFRSDETGEIDRYLNFIEIISLLRMLEPSEVRFQLSSIAHALGLGKVVVVINK